MAGGFSAFMNSPGGQTAVQGGFSIGGNLFSAREAKKANKRNVRLYDKNQAWEERMSNSEWQRGVSDMLSAGINPMLAVSQGGASTPNTNPPTVQPVAKWSGAANSAAKAANLLVLEQQKANIDLTRAQTQKTTSEATSAAGAAKWAEDSARLENMIKGEQWANLKRQYDLTEAQVMQIKEMLPQLLKTEQLRQELTEAQTGSARTARELDELKKPEAQVTAEWFSSMIGGGGRVTSAIQDILKTIMMIRGK